MNRRNFDHIGERLRQERLRLDVAQLAMADACDVSRGTLATWEKGEQSPNAAALAVMAGLGVDVLYVVTGQHANASVQTLAPDERELLDCYGRADDSGRAAIRAVATLAAR
ncbi:helix-turn-helix domain-containing protein [Delftia sp. UME58]|uniref:helix-turn-helix domain-containing protein n=1 Tax=Delftia sp. UME58 TaxID=1862322 RepID=UPI001600EB6D|nr:helix-turn-helix transcriptional regulator [Delftia sp. UME58]MBB1649316.1 XRE family transcriptional regulator [Delftia sp. UME58]